MHTYIYKKKKVIIGISGGVDSSVAAWILKKKGYKVEGLFMKNWEEDDTKNYCNSSIDLNDAKLICNKLNIVLHTINFSTEYWNNVFKKFIRDLKNFKTPNPDIICNKEIKFKIFFEFAKKKLKADYIATGHYVRKKNINGKFVLLKGSDKNKDQSYFLYTISHKKLNFCLFPIGNLQKKYVRKIALKIDISIAKKKDSTGICFIGKRNFNQFISKYIKEKPGKIISTDGYKLGIHKSLIYYTLGQRKGLGIGGIKNKLQKPWYVVDKDIKKNNLIVAQGLNNKWILSKKFIINKIIWVNRENNIIFPFKCNVKIRYRQKEMSCLIKKYLKNKFKIILNKPTVAITPGQSAVFYIKNICLGGGIIETYKKNI